MTIKSMLGMLLVLLLPLGQANALLLSNWNDADLDASGDSIVVTTGNITNDAGDIIINTWFSMQWQAGASNSLTALGIDTVFYNFTATSSTAGDVESVWEGGLFMGDDLIGDWKTNFAGDTSGGGFGSLDSAKNLEPSGDNGIDPSILFFVLSGDVTFEKNGEPTNSTFTAHVRYENDCSGWASDGTTTDSSSGSCGVTVPEPSIVWLLGSGLALIGFARRRS